MTQTRYRIFKRTWWADAACTIPRAGRKTTVDYVYGSEAAGRACQRLNTEEYGSPQGRGPRGMGHEFEVA